MGITFIRRRYLKRRGPIFISSSSFSIKTFEGVRFTYGMNSFILEKDFSSKVKKVSVSISGERSWHSPVNRSASVDPSLTTSIFWIVFIKTGILKIGFARHWQVCFSIFDFT